MRASARRTAMHYTQTAVVAWHFAAVVAWFFAALARAWAGCMRVREGQPRSANVRAIARTAQTTLAGAWRLARAPGAVPEVRGAARPSRSSASGSRCTGWGWLFEQRAVGRRACGPAERSAEFAEFGRCEPLRARRRAASATPPRKNQDRCPLLDAAGVVFRRLTSSSLMYSNTLTTRATPSTPAARRAAALPSRSLTMPIR